MVLKCRQKRRRHSKYEEIEEGKSRKRGRPKKSKLENNRTNDHIEGKNRKNEIEKSISEEKESEGMKSENTMEKVISNLESTAELDKAVCTSEEKKQKRKVEENLEKLEETKDENNTTQEYEAVDELSLDSDGSLFDSGNIFQLDCLVY